MGVKCFRLQETRHLNVRGKQMKIAYLISMRKGMTRFIYREIDLLEKRGSNIHIFPVPKGEGLYMPKSDWSMYKYRIPKVLLRNFFHLLRYPKEYLLLLVEAVRSNSIADLILAVDFVHQMQKIGISRIHCHFADHKLFVGYYCKRILHLPLSVIMYAYDIYTNPNWSMAFKALNACDKVITVSSYNRKMLINKFKVDPSKIEVIRPFVEIPRSDRRRIKNVLIVARLIERKGHASVFRAVELLARDDINLWVVGQGPVDLKSLARRLGIEDRVVFFGPLRGQALDGVFESCDFFCLPSITVRGAKEGLPVVLVEAMAQGKAVISTNHAGIPELVEEVLVEENDAIGLAKAIELLADNEELRKQQGEKNREIVRERYSEENVNDLKSLLERKPDKKR